MSKRLVIVLALALVAGLAMSAYAEVQNVKVSGDLTFLGIDRSTFALQKTGALKDETAAATIARIRIDADLTDNVMATVRLLNERYWGNETQNTGAASDVNSTIDVDLAYATLKEFLYSPLTLTVGRQELHFGNDMVVGAVATNRVTSTASAFSGRDADLSVRHSFDAVRATLDYNPLVIDLVAAKIQEKVLNNPDDQNLYGINAKYDTKVKNTTVEGYLFTKDSSKKGSVAGQANAESKRDVVNTLGTLVKSQPIKDLTLSLEGAWQFGTFFDNNVGAGVTHNKAVAREAFALETGANYVFSKVKYTPSATVLGAWLTGAKNPPSSANGGSNLGAKRYTGWDPMFENQKYGDIADLLFGQSNVRLMGLVGTAKPMSDVTVKGEYYAYWWDKKFTNGSTTLAPMAYDGTTTYTMTGKRFAGQELDLTAMYNYTEDVQFSLMGGWLLPGASFNNDINGNMASEVIGSMKVTF